MLAVTVAMPLFAPAADTNGREVLDRAVDEADARLRDRLDDCRRRFVAAACEESARHEHRDRIAELRRQELAIDEAERRRAADARRSGLASRAADRAERDRAAASSAAVPAQAGPGSTAPTDRRVDDASPAPGGRQSGAVTDGRPATRSTPPAVDRGLVPRTSSRAAEERRSIERHDERQREIAAHRAAVERREAARAAAGKVAPPLPDPASAPRR